MNLISNSKDAVLENNKAKKEIRIQLEVNSSDFEISI